jgi:hypothetical protein
VSIENEDNTNLETENKTVDTPDLDTGGGKLHLQRPQKIRARRLKKPLLSSEPTVSQSKVELRKLSLEQQALHKVHRLSRFLRLQESTENYSIKTNAATSTTRKVSLSRSKALGISCSADSIRTSRRQS